MKTFIDDLKEKTDCLCKHDAIFVFLILLSNSTFFPDYVSDLIQGLLSDLSPLAR
jgi:hypothetical protein